MPRRADACRLFLKPFTSPKVGHIDAGGKRSDAGNGFEPAALCVVTVPACDLPLELGDLLAHRLEVLTQPLNELAHHLRQSVFAVFEDLGKTLSDVPNPFGDHDPELGQQPLRGARLHKCLTGSVQDQHSLLFHGLHGHKTRMRPPYRFADRFGIVTIALVRLHVGLHKLRRYQMCCVTQLREFPDPVVRTPAGFHADQTSLQIGKERQRVLALELLAQRTFSTLINTGTLENILDKSMPIVVAFIRTPPSNEVVCYNAPLWHFRCRLRRGLHSIISGLEITVSLR